MFYDRGPVDRIDVADFPTAGEPSNFAGLAGALGDELDAARRGLVDRQLTMATDDGGTIDSDLGLALGTVQVELEGEAGGIDPAIGDVAGSADTLRGDLAGLSSEAGSDLSLPPPTPPNIPPGADQPPGPDNPNFVAWDTGILGQFVQILGRSATTAEVIASRGFYPNFDAAIAWIRTLAATAPPSTPAPPPTPPPPATARPPAWPSHPEDDAFANQVRAWYHELLARDPAGDEIDSHRGNPGGLPGVHNTILTSDEYRSKHGG